MIIFWGEGFLRKIMQLLLLAAIGLFCWGWITNVALGRMTTRQYINKLYNDIHRGVITTEGEVRARMDRVSRNVRTWYGPEVSQT